MSNVKMYKDILKWKISKTKNSDIVHIDKYHPYKKGKNLQFDQFSREILELKENSYKAVKGVFHSIKDCFAGNNIEAITVVPPHDPEDKTNGIEDLSTTGNSLNACRNLLLEAGASRVKMFALGSTSWQKENE